MNAEEIRKFQRHEPFQPFEIVLVDGRRFVVPHPEFILVPPGRGTWIYVADESGGTEHINTMIISSVRHRNGDTEAGPTTNGAPS